MACGGCKRRRELARKAWRQSTPPEAATGSMSGGIGRKVTSSGHIGAHVKVLTAGNHQ